MKKARLLREIAAAARTARAWWQMERQGREHEIWRCGNQKVVIPRHREINEITAHNIFKDLEGELGERWWRR